MAINIARRKFIAALGGAAVAWPITARGQQPMPTVGFLHAGSLEPVENQMLLAAFLKGLNETGYVEDQNVAIEYRWAEGHYDRLPGMAADLVRRRVAVIATPGTTQAAIAAKAATTTIPIVFAIGGDAIALSLVASLNRPGGNVTGFSLSNTGLEAKRLDLLRELVPGAAHYVALVNPNSVLTDSTVKDLQVGAAIIGLQIEVLTANTKNEINAAFARLTQKSSSTLIVSPDTLFSDHVVQIVMLAARYAVPAIYPRREFTVAGGLMSYGPNFANVYRQAGIYTGRILKGEKPADMPVQQPTKFEFVINQQTATMLSIVVPTKLLAIADDVIE